MRLIKRGAVILAVTASVVVTGSAWAQSKGDKYKEARDLVRSAKTLLSDFAFLSDERQPEFSREMRSRT